MQLKSPAFSDGERIPDRFSYTEENVNPPLSISGVPERTISLALIVDDADAVNPAGKVWDMWIVWNIDADIRESPAGWDAAEATVGRNDFGEIDYGGPNPPDQEHTYRFKLYALDCLVDLEEGEKKERVIEQMKGRILDSTRLDGTFSPD